MNRLLTIVALCLLSGCINLPGDEGAASTRYSLQGLAGDCEAGDRALDLSVVRVAAGLDNNRVARRNSGTGEFTYLKGLRWVDSIDVMLEQRMAADLECRGFVVQTGHRTRMSYGQLLCEVRALNLVQGVGGDEAEVALSCMYREPGGKQARPLLESASARVDRWNSSNAMAALGAAYQQVMENLAQQLR